MDDKEYVLIHVEYVVKEERKEREMIAKGFKKLFILILISYRDDEGKWIRDETVEFDSDDEPTL